MHKATIDELVNGIDSRYTLITLVSKRAREIIDGDEILTKVGTIKPVSIAIEEYTDKKIYPIYGESHIANSELDSEISEGTEEIIETEELEGTEIEQ